VAAASVEEIIARLILAGQQQFSHGAKEAAQDIKGIGTQAKETSSQASKSMSGIRFPDWKNKLKGFAKFAAGASALYAAKRGLESAVSGTEDLAKATIQLQRTTGLDSETASKWAEIAKVRGIDATALNRSLVVLSRNMVNATQGNKKSVAAFDALGVSMDSVRAGDTSTVMMQMANGLKNMKNPAERAALTQQLLSRNGQAMLPVFMQGSKAINDQMNMAQKYGAVIGGEGVNHTKEFLARQREMKMAMDGLKVSVGTALMPVILTLTAALAKLAATFQPLLRSGTAVKIMLGTLVFAFLALKALNIVTSIAAGAEAMRSLALGTKAAAAAQWLLNLAMEANPIGIIIAALVALGVAFVVLYKKVGWFRNAVNTALNAVKNAAVAVFGWIKGHWPLLVAILTGPFGVAVYAIVKHFKTVKQAARDAINFLIKGWNSLQFKVPGFKAGPVHFGGFSLGVPKIPLLASGGLVTSPGAAVVGDQGPEIVSLPRGAGVSPIPSLPSLSALIRVPVFLDKRQIALATAEYNSDVAARKGNA
jgi:hypothetical protein